MKRVLFTAMMLIGLCLSASAQKEALYLFSVEGMDFEMRNWIDRSKKMFYFDSDSDEGTMLMKNYKKNGNKETFDLYMKFDPSIKFASMTIITDPNLKVAPGMNLKTQTITEKGEGYTKTSGFLTQEQEKMYDKVGSKSGGDSASAGSAAPEGGNAIDKAKAKGKDLLNKGKNLFKKKK